MLNIKNIIKRSSFDKPLKLDYKKMREYHDKVLMPLIKKLDKPQEMLQFAHLYFFRIGELLENCLYQCWKRIRMIDKWDEYNALLEKAHDQIFQINIKIFANAKNISISQASELMTPRHLKDVEAEREEREKHKLLCMSEEGSYQNKITHAKELIEYILEQKIGEIKQEFIINAIYQGRISYYMFSTDHDYEKALYDKELSEKTATTQH